MIQKWQWAIIHALYSLLREVDWSYTSKDSQITPAVLWMNINKNPGISQSLFVIPALVRWYSQVHPKFSLALRHAPKLITITPIILLYQSSEMPVTPVPVVRDPSYSEGLPEYPPRVWYSPEIDASKFTLHILSDTPGVFQRLKYILLMKQLDCTTSIASTQNNGIHRIYFSLHTSFNRSNYLASKWNCGLISIRGVDWATSQSNHFNL